jgi:hypothetical protein
MGMTINYPFYFVATPTELPMRTNVSIGFFELTRSHITPRHLAQTALALEQQVLVECDRILLKHDNRRRATKRKETELVTATARAHSGRSARAIAHTHTPSTTLTAQHRLP